MLNRLRKHKKFIFIYTVLFLILYFLGIQIWFMLNNKSYIWYLDGLQQQYVSFIYVGKWLRSIIKNLFIHHRFIIPMWNMSMGYGSDIITTLGGVFMDPFNYLSVLVPTSLTEFLFSFIVFFKIYLAGISFYAFCAYKKKDQRSSLVGSLLYCFSPAFLIVFKQAAFANLFIYFPLIMLGCEKVWYEKKGTLLFISLFLMSAYSFYFTYMIVIGIIIYYAIKFFFDNDEKTWRRFFELIYHFSFHRMFGVACGLLANLSIIINLAAASRLSIQRIIPLFYNWETIKIYFTNYFQIIDVGADALLGFSIVTFLSIMILFLSKGNKHLKISFILLTTALFSSKAGSIFNGFNYATYRWNFLYNFLIMYIVVETFPLLLKIEKKDLLKIVVGFSVYSMSFLFLTHFSFHNFWMNLTLISILFILLLFNREKLSKYKNQCIAVIFIFSSLINTTIYFSPDKNDFINQELNRNEALYKIRADGKGLIENKYKTNNIRFDEIGTSRYRNSDMITSLNSYNFYFSYYNNNIDDFHNSIGYSSIQGANFNFSYLGLGYYEYLHLLNGTKYIIMPSDYYKSPPYSYNKLIKQEDSYGKKYSLYTTDKKVSMAHFYKDVISESDYDQLGEFNRYQTLLRAISLDNQYKNCNVKKAIGQYGYLNYQLTLDKGIKNNQNYYETEKDNASFHLKINKIKDKQIYLQINNLDFLSNNSDWYGVTIEAYHQNKKINTMMYNLYSQTLKSHLYANKHNWLINLGYADKNVDDIKITLSHKGKYKISNISLYTKTRRQIANDISHLDSENIDFEYNTNKIDILTNKNEAGYLYIAVPYSKNWEAKVDGIKSEVLKANKAFMAIKLSKGKHKIQLTYKQKNVLIGISGMFLVLCFYTVLNFIFKRRRVNYDII